MSDELANALASEDAEKAELRKKVHDLERKILQHGDLEAQLANERKRADTLEREYGVLERIGVAGSPGWLTTPPKSKAGHHATAWLLLSDLHLDEVVSAEEVRGVNAFDRAIAEMRLRAIGENFVKLLRDHWSGITYDGVVLAMGGDIFTGEIHEELTQTNEDTILGSFVHWVDPLASLISVLADEFGKIHIPVVVGNHGRMSRKPRAKFRARSNFDWALGHALARSFANDKRVTFDIPDAADCLIQSYGQSVLLTHGDQATGGSGIGGIWPPIMRLAARKRAQGDATGAPFNLLALGHWHQYVSGPEFIVNGSLKGYDEYAMVSNFSFEQPQQAAWLMTPEHGRTWSAPVFCQDREAEGW